MFNVIYSLGAQCMKFVQGGGGWSLNPTCTLSNLGTLRECPTDGLGLLPLVLCSLWTCLLEALVSALCGGPAVDWFPLLPWPGASRVLLSACLLWGMFTLCPWPLVRTPAWSAWVPEMFLPHPRPLRACACRPGVAGGIPGPRPPQAYRFRAAWLPRMPVPGTQAAWCQRACKWPPHPQ